MQAAIDIGNSRSKVGIFQSSELVNSYQIEENPDEIILALCQKFPDVKSIIVSSVNKEMELEAYKIPDHINSLLLQHNTPLPIKNSYESPESLGHDRIALAVAANTQFPKSNVLIIDMGTCVTMDIVDENGIYLGGSISPGANLRYESMHTGTARLPLIEFDQKNLPELIGKNTRSCMESGVVQGLIHEITGTINHLNTEFVDLKIMMTGGDHKLFDKALKNSIFADSNAVLRGLNQILLHNFPNE